VIAFLIAFLTTLPALAGGLVEPRISSLFFLLAIAAFGTWALIQSFLGRIPTPNIAETLWAATLIILSGISVELSRIPFAATNSWRTLIVGLWIFPAISLVSQEDRKLIDNGIIFSAWILVFIAFVQLLLIRPEEFNAFLPNPNIFAGLLIMILPIALERKDRGLILAMAVCLLLARSVGAWLSLAAAAAIILGRKMPRKTRWSAIVILSLCLMALLRKTFNPDFINRWIWWKAAFQIFIKNPWFGCGPGIFAYLLPLYVKANVQAHLWRSLYAHQYYLQTAAECGAPYLLIFILGIASFFPKSPMRRWAVLSALISVIWDYSLAIPANFWLFCYLAASERPVSHNLILVSQKRKPFYVLLILSLTWILIKPVWARWQEERLKSSAIALFNSGAPIVQSHNQFLRAIHWYPDPDAERLATELEIKAINQGLIPKRLGLPEAIFHLERSVKENPYRASSWEMLVKLDELIGKKDKAAAARFQERLYCGAQ
jgi:hypothetical protein